MESTSEESESAANITLEVDVATDDKAGESSATNGEAKKKTR